TVLPPRDFKSLASADFATPAYGTEFIIAQIQKQNNNKIARENKITGLVLLCSLSRPKFHFGVRLL
ncbi:hypothetical protein, partial [Faecalispora jeddahensis]|uniref:hypothetical protein n=1 Tax=Faecalispora jeddahensis TaxID=1414721 RepID=UPI0027B8FA9B